MPFVNRFIWLVNSQGRLPLSRLQWRHNGRDSTSNHRPHDCLLNRLFRRRSKKHQSSASLAFVGGIQRSPVNSPHKGPVTRKMFPFDDVTMHQKTINGACRLAVIFGAILVPSHVVKFVQLIWRSGICRWNLRVPDLELNCSDFT